MRRHVRLIVQITRKDKLFAARWKPVSWDGPIISMQTLVWQRLAPTEKGDTSILRCVEMQKAGGIFATRLCNDYLI